jgi:hypothetical protein
MKRVGDEAVNIEIEQLDGGLPGATPMFIVQ